MNKIRLSPLAIEDLQTIQNYISNELCNPIAADRIIRKITKDYSLLAISPQMGSPLYSRIKIATDYRYLVSGKYIIFYKIEHEYISIYRILHGTRDYIKLLFNDDITDDNKI